MEPSFAVVNNAIEEVAKKVKSTNDAKGISTKALNERLLKMDDELKQVKSDNEELRANNEELLTKINMVENRENEESTLLDELNSWIKKNNHQSEEFAAEFNLIP